MSKEYRAVFYDEDEKEISRKTYKTYGGMINYGYKHADKIGAIFFYHVEYLRRFEVYEDDESDCNDNPYLLTGDELNKAIITRKAGK